jgi:AraC-like DNA-binding protein
MASTALDLGLRGVAVGLFLVICIVLLRCAPLRVAARLALAMSVAGAAYAISTAPFFPMGSFGWNSPFVVLSMGFPVVFWLWARAIFDENFALRPWHGGLWALVAGLGLMAYNGRSEWPDLAATCGRLLALASIGFALLAAAQIPGGWRAGPLTGRTSLRIALVVGITIHLVLTAASGLAAIPLKSMSLTYSLALGVSALLAAWLILFYGPQSRPAVVGSGAAGRASEPVSHAGVSASEQASLHRLDHVMTIERAYRREGLTIGTLAVRLGIPEHRLRGLINDGLGHRNFNAFLNRYRIEEAKTALADPGQIDVPVLTIALDSGFQSLAPFNRAFKADTGLTPTEFRRRATAADRGSAYSHRQFD